MFIVLVYARLLITTGTLYWNAADGALDGFTSLLDVFVKAILLSFSPDHVVDAVYLRYRDRAWMPGRAIL